MSNLICGAGCGNSAHSDSNLELPSMSYSRVQLLKSCQRDLFERVSDESRELNLVAGSTDGAISVAMGEAVWRSAIEQRPIHVTQLLNGTDGTTTC